MIKSAAELIKGGGIVCCALGAVLMPTAGVLFVVGSTPDVITAQPNPRVTGVQAVPYLSRSNRIMSMLPLPTGLLGLALLISGCFLLGVEIEEEEEENLLLFEEGNPEDDRIARLEQQIQTLIQGQETLIQVGRAVPAEQDVSTPPTQGTPLISSDHFPPPPVFETQPQQAQSFYEMPPGAYKVGKSEEMPSLQPEIEATEPYSFGLEAGEDWDAMDGDIPFFSEEGTISDLLERSIEQQRHVLFAAPTRTGKTSQIVAAMRQIIENRGGVERYGELVQFTVIDPKGEFWGGLEFVENKLLQFVSPKSTRTCPSVFRVDRCSSEQEKGRKVLAVLELVEKLRQIRAKHRTRMNELKYARRFEEADAIANLPVVRFPFVLILDEWLTTIGGIDKDVANKIDDLKSAILRMSASDNIFVWQVAHSPLVGNNFPNGEAQDQLLKVALGRIGKPDSITRGLERWVSQSVQPQIRQSIASVEKRYGNIPYAFSPQGHDGQTYGIWLAENLSKEFEEINGQTYNIIRIFPPPARLLSA